MLEMNYGFSRVFDGRGFIKLLFELKLRNVMDGSVLTVGVSTGEALKVLGSAIKKVCPSELLWGVWTW